MRRMLLMVMAAAVSALGIVPALAQSPVDGQLCGDVVVVVDGEAVVDEHDCLPPEDTEPPELPIDPGTLPELPIDPGTLPEIPDPGTLPEIPELPVDPGTLPV